MACKDQSCGCICKITGLSHIGIFVKDMKVSLDFYKNILGFECYSESTVTRDDGITLVAFLRCGTCEIELIQHPVYHKRSDGPVDHIALAVEDIDCMKKCLEKKGVEYETKDPIELSVIKDNGVRYIFFRGPDGERLELSQVL